MTDKLREETGEAIRMAVSRAWCAPANAHKVFDADLAEAIVKEVSDLFHYADEGSTEKFEFKGLARRASKEAE